MCAARGEGGGLIHKDWDLEGKKTDFWGRFRSCDQSYRAAFQKIGRIDKKNKSLGVKSLIVHAQHPAVAPAVEHSEP